VAGARWGAGAGLLRPWPGGWCTARCMLCTDLAMAHLQLLPFPWRSSSVLPCRSTSRCRPRLWSASAPLPVSGAGSSAGAPACNTLPWQHALYRCSSSSCRPCKHAAPRKITHCISVPLQAGRTTRCSFLSWPAHRPRCPAWRRPAAAGAAASAKPRAAATVRTAARTTAKRRPASQAAAMLERPCLTRRRAWTRQLQQELGGRRAGLGGEQLRCHRQRRESATLRSH